MKYRVNPTVVDAVQITHEWFTGDHPNPLHPVGLQMDPLTRTVELKIKESVILANIGDWIVTGPKGVRYPVHPHIFETAYEPIEEGKDNEPTEQ